MPLWTQVPLRTIPGHGEACHHMAQTHMPGLPAVHHFTSRSLTAGSTLQEQVRGIVRSGTSAHRDIVLGYSGSRRYKSTE